MAGKGQFTDSSAVRRCAKPVAVSVLVGILVCIAVLLLLSVVITARDVPQSLIDPMALFAMAAGAFVSGVVCAKAMRSKGLLYGALCGGVITLLMLMAGVAVSENGLGIPALFRILFVMLPAMLGGVLGVNTRKKHR